MAAEEPLADNKGDLLIEVKGAAAKGRTAFLPVNLLVGKDVDQQVAEETTKLRRQLTEPQKEAAC